MQRSGPLQMFHSPIQFPQIGPYITQIAESCHIIRSPLKHLPEKLDGLRKLSCLLGQNAHLLQGLHLLGIDGQYLPVESLRLLQTALGLMLDAQLQRLGKTHGCCIHLNLSHAGMVGSTCKGSLS